MLEERMPGPFRGGPGGGSSRGARQAADIDVGRLLRIVRDRWYLALLPIVASVALAVFHLSRATPVYQATGEVLVESAPLPMEAGLILGRELAQQDPGTRQAIIQSPLVLRRAAALLESWGYPEIAASLGRKGVVQTTVSEEVENVIQVHVRGRTPEAAQLGARAVLQAYQQFNEDEVRSQASSTREFLEEQLQRTKQEWQQAEAALRDFQRKNGIISLEDEARRLNQQLGTLESELARTSIALEARQQALAELESRLAAEREKLPEVATNPAQRLVDELQAQLAQLETQRTDYLARGLEPSAPEVRMLERRIQGVRERLENLARELATDEASSLRGMAAYEALLGRKAQVQSEILDLQNQVGLLKGEIATYKEHLRSLSDTGQELARLERDVEVAANTFKALREEVERARLTEASKVSFVRILRDPGLPTRPVEPNPQLTLGAAVVLGSFFGLGLAFLGDFVDNRVKGAEQLEGLGLRVLGRVPLVPARRPGLTVRGRDRGDPLLRSLVRIESNLRFVGEGHPARVVGITSSIPGEGKSAIAFNLAYVLAQVGDRVLLVDCDVMNPELHRIALMSVSPGLTELLGGEVDPEAVVRFPFSAEGVNLGVIPAGARPVQSGAVFRADALSDMLQHFRGAYDWILLDTPPIQVAPDAVQLLRRLDGALLVVKERAAPFAAVREVLEQLRTSGVRTLGVVLNGARTRSWDQRTYRYYSVPRASAKDGAAPFSGSNLFRTATRRGLGGPHKPR